MKKLYLALLIVSSNIKISCGDQERPSLNPILVRACKDDDAPKIQRYINRGTNINQKNKQTEYTLLHFTAYHNSGEATSVLLAGGADINAHDNRKNTPLHIAAKNNSDKATSVLLNAGSDINAPNFFNYTPLHLAAMKASDEALVQLIAAGADVDAISHCGDTALMLAAQYGTIETMKTLLSAGADVNMTSNYGQTAFTLAHGPDGENKRELILEAIKESETGILLK